MSQDGDYAERLGSLGLAQHSFPKMERFVGLKRDPLGCTRLKDLVRIPELRHPLGLLAVLKVPDKCHLFEVRQINSLQLSCGFDEPFRLA